MALSIEEKNTLDSVIEEIMNDYLKTGYDFCSADIRAKAQEKCDFRISVNSIIPSIKRVIYGTKVEIEPVGYHTKYYHIIGYVSDMENSIIRKDKNILHFNVTGEPFFYDFQTKKFSQPLNKVRLFAHIKKNIENMVKYEWLYNYTNDLDLVYNIIRNCDEDIYATCPKGFEKYLKENHATFSYQAIRECFYENAIPDSNEYTFFKNFCRSNYGDYKRYAKFFTAKQIQKMIMIDTKNYILNDRYDIASYLDTIMNVIELVDNNDFIDFNRGIEKNYKNALSIRDKEKNNLLAKRLQKLNFINGLENDDLIVVVPQSQEDKLAEGKMQNNCVGSYYDNSILNGENYIYFIRKKDTPNKSYITCRYNNNKQYTAEYKGKNNSVVNNKKALDFIKSIDNIINENL